MSMTVKQRVDAFKAGIAKSQQAESAGGQRIYKTELEAQAQVLGTSTEARRQADAFLNTVAQDLTDGAKEARAKLLQSTPEPGTMTVDQRVAAFELGIAESRSPTSPGGQRIYKDELEAHIPVLGTSAEALARGNQILEGVKQDLTDGAKEARAKLVTFTRDLTRSEKDRVKKQFEQTFAPDNKLTLPTGAKLSEAEIEVLPRDVHAYYDSKVMGAQSMRAKAECSVQALTVDDKPLYLTSRTFTRSGDMDITLHSQNGQYVADGYYNKEQGFYWLGQTPKGGW